jgi:hypothetical protein
MFQIKMNINVHNPNAKVMQNMAHNLASKTITHFAPKHMPLNAPMIDRVHKAKSGCSACGKKVA